MVRLAHWVLRHKLAVSLFWLVALLAGGATAATTTERLTVDFSLPGQPGYQTEKQLVELYGTGADEGVSTIAVTSPDGPVGERADAVFAAVRQQFPQYRVVDGSVADREDFTTADGRTAYGLVVDTRFTGFDFSPAYRSLAPLLEEQASALGLEIGTTAYFQLSEGDAAEGEAEPPSVLGETLLGAAGALVVLVFVFASFLALVPMLVAAVSILATLLCVLAVTAVTDVSFVVQFLVSLVGLGLAIDYSLLVVNRWREEREAGLDPHDATVEAVRTAGSAVVSSAGTVAISLLALVLVPVPFLRSMGIGGMLIPLVSTAVVLTLLPVLLATVGRRVDWPRVRHERSASRAWTAWAGFVVRRRWVVAGVGTLLLAALVAPVAMISIGNARTSSLATQGPAVSTLATLRDGGVPAGVVTPLEVLVRGGRSDAERVAALVDGVEGVAFAVAPEDPAWARSGTAVLEVVPEQELVDLASAAVVDRVRAAAQADPAFVGVAGIGATVQDYDRAVFDRFPLVMALVALVTFLLLVRAFRSLLLPLKAVLLNVLSVAATFGFVVLFWQLGYGSQAVFGIEETGAITFWIPVMIFAFLFGLSMDYEVFILARMREEYDRTGSTRTAVVEGLGRTGRLVTCAALILFWAFTALAQAPGTEIKLLATALGVGILLDATIVRALLVPALVSLLGRWNWWLPAWLARPLRVEPSPAVHEPVDLPAQRGEPRAPAPLPR